MQYKAPHITQLATNIVIADFNITQKLIQVIFNPHNHRPRAIAQIKKMGKKKSPCLVQGIHDAYLKRHSQKQTTFSQYSTTPIKLVKFQFSWNYKIPNTIRPSNLTKPIT